MTQGNQMMEPNIAYPVTEGLQGLPHVPPEVSMLVFSGPQEGWPPRPQDRTNVMEVYAQEIPGSLTDDLEDQIRTAALQDERVQALLGDRFGYITTDQSQLVKGRNPNPSELLATRVIFFSNTNNVAVEVLMQGLEVQSVSINREYQPPESDYEIETAIALAQADDRLKDKVQGLIANAILLPISEEGLGYRHRVLWITFSQSEDEEPVLFSAAVDLTDQKVLTARTESAPL